jgi:hypothetical protein
MHFGTKSYLKNTCNHTAKHALTFKGKGIFVVSMRFTRHYRINWEEIDLHHFFLYSIMIFLSLKAKWYIYIYIVFLSCSSLIAHKIIKITLWSKKKEEETCFSISPFTNPVLGISFFSYILGAKSYI